MSSSRTVDKARKLDQALLAMWAAECAERVLPQFERTHPDDDRPRRAIEAARAWVRGEITMTHARKAAFATHAAARKSSHPAAIAAARAAGHAAGTAHVAGHAKHAAVYAVKAAEDPDAERAWQLNRVPKQLRIAAGFCNP